MVNDPTPGLEWRDGPGEGRQPLSRSAGRSRIVVSCRLPLDPTTEAGTRPVASDKRSRTEWVRRAPKEAIDGQAQPGTGKAEESGGAGRRGSRARPRKSSAKDRQDRSGVGSRPAEG